MHEPLLSRLKLEAPGTPRGTSRGTPRGTPRGTLRGTPSSKQLGSGYVDQRIIRCLSSAKQVNNDTVLPVIRTPKVSSIAELVINFHRSNSAPALCTNEKGIVKLDSLDPKKRRCRLTPPKIITIALLGLLLYIIIGVTVFTCTRDMFKGHQTDNKFIDALYFTVVTLCTIGYGDMVPDTTVTKLITCVFILVGFGFIDILLNGLFTHVLDLQEEILLGTLDENRFNKMVRTYIIDKHKGRMRIRIKMGLALGVVVLCLAIGTVTLHLMENMAWVDSFYLSVTSVTTVGYGDHAFKTASGRCFAIIWLLCSTFAVARAFLYLTEYRIEKRNRRTANEVLHKKLTLADLAAADMDHDGSVSKAEYVVFKLKEMGKISENEIDQICEQFDTIEDSHHHSKITVADLMEDYAENGNNSCKHDGPETC